MNDDRLQAVVEINNNITCFLLYYILFVLNLFIDCYLKLKKNKI